MERRQHGGARPGAGRKSAEQTAVVAMVLDTVVQLAICQERMALWLRTPLHDPSVGELRALALERLRRQFAADVA